MSRLIKAIKNKGIEIDDATELILEQIEAQFDVSLRSFGEGYLTKEGLEEEIGKVKEEISAANIKIDGKSIEDILRKQGEEISSLRSEEYKRAVSHGVKSILDKNWDKIKKQFETKSELTLTVKDAVIMGTGNTIDEDTNSIPADLIESYTISSFVKKRYGRNFISELADRVTVPRMTRSMTTWLEQGDVEGSFAIVEEGELKPMVSADLVRNYTEAKKVAGKAVFNDEFPKFREEAYNIIREIINDQMIRDFNAQLLTQINSAATPYVATPLDGTIDNPNYYDAIGAAATQLAMLNFEPNVIVVSPADKWKMRLAKGSDGHYLFPMTTQDGVIKFAEFQIISSTYQPAGYFTLAEAGLFKIREEPVQIKMGRGLTIPEEGDPEHDFDHNRFRIILETFYKAWLASPHAGSILRDEFSTIMAALETEDVEEGGGGGD